MPYLETDFDRGYKKGLRDGVNPPIILDPYVAGFEAGPQEYRAGSSHAGWAWDGPLGHVAEPGRHQR